MTAEADLSQGLPQFRQDFAALKDGLASVLVGQAEAIELTLAALLGGGHVLLDGPPGVGKTVLGRSLAMLLDADFRRIQFTSDLMPADIIGTYVVMESAGRRKFEFVKGPIFTNLLLADEINRATPKTQAALFEALDERSLTVANEIYPLPQPFFTIATQSLSEIEGTYPIPETQLDRFFFKINMPAPRDADLETILQRTTEGSGPALSAVADAARVAAMARLVRQVAVPADVRGFVARLISATHPAGGASPDSIRRFLLRGASPRAGQAMLLGGKALALAAGRNSVSREDVSRLAVPALRHRLALNFEGHAEEAGVDGIVREMLKNVK